MGRRRKKNKGAQIATIAVAAVATVATAGLAAAGAAGAIGSSLVGAAAAETVIIGSATVGNVIGGAVIGAGVGATTGAVQAGIVGENILEGAVQGAGVGALSGAAGMVGAGVGGQVASAAGIDPTASALDAGLQKSIVQASKGATAFATGAAVQDQNVGEWAAVGAITGAATPLVTTGTTAAFGPGTTANIAGGVLGGALGGAGAAAVSGGDVGAAALTGAGTGGVGAAVQPYVQQAQQAIFGTGGIQSSPQVTQATQSAITQGVSPTSLLQPTSADFPTFTGDEKTVFQDVTPVYEEGGYGGGFAQVEVPGGGPGPDASAFQAELGAEEVAGTIEDLARFQAEQRLGAEREFQTSFGTSKISPTDRLILEQTGLIPFGSDRGGFQFGGDDATSRGGGLANISETLPSRGFQFGGDDTSRRVTTSPIEISERTREGVTTAPTAQTGRPPSPREEAVRISPIVNEPRIGPRGTQAQASTQPLLSAGGDPATSGGMFTQFGTKNQVWNEATLRLADALGLL